MAIELSNLIGATYQGLQGIQGVQGFGYEQLQGLQGLQGISGAGGSVGLQGTQGLQGVQGLQGLQGITGSQGTQGTQGLQGLQGITGAQGLQGLQGIAGPGTTINATDDTTTNASFYPVLVSSAGSAQTATVTTTKLYFNPSTGDFSATNVNTLSDARLKYDFVEIESPLEVLNSLKAWKFKFTDSHRESIGVVAQQLEEVLPELVTSNPNGDKTVAYNGIIGLLIEAVKELNVLVKQK